VTKCVSKHVSGCNIVIKIKTPISLYVKVNHHLHMSVQLGSQVSSNFIVQLAVSSEGSCAQLSTTSFIFECCVFLKKMVGTNPFIVFDDKENCDKEDKKKGPLCMLIFHNYD
jgi:hypothetical protein